MEQRLHQAAEEHRVGDIADKKLVKTDHQGLRCYAVSHLLKGILLPRQFRQVIVHSLHEAVEMHPEFGFKGQAFIKHVHQVGLATANPAPQVESLLGGLGAPQQASQARSGFPLPLRTRHQTIVQILQRRNCRRLGGIGLEPGAREIRFVMLLGGQMGHDAGRLPEKL